MIPHNIENILDSLKGKRVLVAGDLILDHYLEGIVERISPEAPVPIVSLESSQGHWVPGGAANVARNICSLGGIPVMAGVYGSDREGQLLVELLEGEAIDTGAMVMDAERPTTSKTRIMSDGHQLIRLDREVTRPVPAEIHGEIIRRIAEIAHRLDAIILEDYNKGVLVPALIAQVIALARERDIPVAVDPKFINFFEFRGCTLFKPNRNETARALGIELRNVEDVKKAGETLLDRLDAESILITLGGEGSVLCRRGRQPFHRPAVARHVYDVSGAGDTVIAVMTMALAAGVPLEDGVRLSVFAAAATCSEPGVYAVRPGDIIREVEHFARSDTD